MLGNRYPPLQWQIHDSSWIHCYSWFLPIYFSYYTFITMPPYQQPNNDGSCFFSVLCPRGWLSSFHGGCFKVHSNPLDWNSAKSACEALGSSLALPNSKAKSREFLQLFNGAGASNELWIGLYRDPKNERRWLWVDGSTAYFTFWHTGEPSNHGSNEDCVEFRMMSGKWKWNDKACGYHRPYICEINGKYNILHEHIYNWWFETGFKPRGCSTNVYTERLRPRVFTKKVPLSYTFYWQIVHLSHLFRTLRPF